MAVYFVAYETYKNGACIRKRSANVHTDKKIKTADDLSNLIEEVTEEIKDILQKGEEIYITNISKV